MSTPDLYHDSNAPLSRRARPLSPHLQIYKPQISSVLSIFHRATGVALCFGMPVVAGWLIAAAAGPDAYDQFQYYAGSIIGQIVLLGWAWALMYHTLAGVRHLVWDAGYGFDIPTFTKSGWAVVLGSFLLTAMIAAYAYDLLAQVQS